MTTTSRPAMTHPTHAPHSQPVSAPSVQIDFQPPAEAPADNGKTSAQSLPRSTEDELQPATQVMIRQEDPNKAAESLTKVEFSEPRSSAPQLSATAGQPGPEVAAQSRQHGGQPSSRATEAQSGAHSSNLLATAHKGDGFCFHR